MSSLVSYKCRRIFNLFTSLHMVHNQIWLNVFLNDHHLGSIKKLATKALLWNTTWFNHLLTSHDESRWIERFQMLKEIFFDIYKQLKHLISKTNKNTKNIFVSKFEFPTLRRSSWFLIKLKFYAQIKMYWLLNLKVIIQLVL
jgi:hypothetical protein